MIQPEAACRAVAADVDILRPEDAKPCDVGTEEGLPIRERTATRFAVWTTTTKANLNAVAPNGERERFQACRTASAGPQSARNATNGQRIVQLKSADRALSRPRAQQDYPQARPPHS